MELTGINAQSIFDDNAATLRLSWLTGHEGWERGFTPESVATATSSADLVGHLNLIHPNRIQVLGEAELRYYQRLTDENRKRHMGEVIALEPPFLVVADGLEAPPDLVLRCTRSSTPLFTTPLSTASVIDSLRLYISRVFAPRCTMHGVFIDILGMGVLLTGDSGLGKSELGLELISRGHGLVADDAVDFVRLGPDFVEGRCPPLLQNLLEVRGLGLLDIKTIFGETAVRRKMKLKLIVQLVRRPDGEFQRLPLEAQTVDVLGLPINKVILQVAAGRNLAVLVEAAVRNTILQLRGIDTLKDFMERQRQAMQDPDGMQGKLL
ncbi:MULTISPECIES: HPr(Ser) kinase/phosphatase [Pandoraea]|uniref:HPr kinase/phosphorylase n=7 Tax=Pandoraea TaxID=93217 RepID=A0A5E4WRT8_9BURK|nr:MULTISPECIES: HPr(Ser) kinase/phosphatase [Pandoraea]MCI3206311.1 HPr kinase/phosphorylase [Pandoraea sp. LA3]AJC15886.1 HPr kinase/phosphorylase [Pandoraea sputorum]AKC69341.1 HPr kinase/phosphorylase [Pandoraea oxalativorans]MCE4060810.1 HPr(Ser) kinase/phosphatase [Pandoraea sputorum]MDN4584339.1 HPr kinase/phosphorylase [Pandoraea capi]